MDAGYPDRSELRLADSDRDRVVVTLRDACVDGRITLDEFADYAGSVYAARTFGDLDDVIRNLPVAASAPLPVRQPPLPDAWAPPPPPAGYTAPAPPATTRAPGSVRRWIIAVMSGQKRKGRWRVADQTTVLAFWGGVDLDLRGALIESPQVEITAIAVMGAVEITVPEGIPVEMDGFVLMGGSENRVSDIPVLPGAPLVRVRAYGMWGGVTVRSKPEDDKARRRQDRAQRRTERRDNGGSTSHSSPQSAPQSLATPPFEPIPPMPPPPIPVPLATDAPPVVDIPEVVAFDEQRNDDDLDALVEQIEQHPPELIQHAAPDGTVTLLFSDIQDSAGWAERLGDHRWMDVLHQHDALVRGAVTRFGGTELKAQGDGFMVAFASARRAVLCAIAVQQALADFRSHHPDRLVNVRIGLHTGEVIRDSGDMFGKHVILAARIAGEARAGEILVSSLVKELTDSGGDLEFDDGHEVNLRGLARAYRVHAVRWK